MTTKKQLAAYGEWSPPGPRKPGRPRKDPGDPKQKYTKKKKPVLNETVDDHANYVLHQEKRQGKVRGNKPTRIVKQDIKLSRYLIGDMLLDRIAAGELLKEILTEDGMPTFTQVQRWRRDNLYEFEDRYQWALQSQAEAMADDIIILADGARDPRDKRIMFDARKFRIAHQNPEKWGERMTVAGDPKNPLLQTNVRVEIAALSDSELAALEAFAQARKEATQPRALDVPFTDVTQQITEMTPESDE